MASREATLGIAYGSSIGTKALMAVTGVLLVLFVIGHMLGNLQIFLGQDVLNHYAELLRTFPEVLWAARIALLAAVVVHAITAIRLTAQNRAARRTRYVVSKPVQVGIPSRTLFLSGIVVAAFVVYHLLHFTFRTTHPQYAQLFDAHGRPDVYSMVILGFREWPISLFYSVAQVLLAMHLWHGASSFYQTLGITSPRWRPLTDGTGPAVAWIVLLGNLSIPLAVMLGLLRLPGGA